MGTCHSGCRGGGALSKGSPCGRPPLIFAGELENCRSFASLRMTRASQRLSRIMVKKAVEE
jgi:hypothetical protein